jgi:squalene-hopene/tetraprenyl-beta-curcumene cyclase
MRRAEAYVHAEAERLAADVNSPVENVSYAIVGLANAGASRSEATVQHLAQNLLESQNTDGGWPLARSSASAAISTGSALYALRLLGYSDQDRAVTRGSQWLVAHQSEDGGWSHGGSARGEAMWAVLGLVTTDVVSVDVQGIQDGAHLDGTVPVQIRARDNEGGSVQRIDVSLDDVTVRSECATQSTYSLDASTLGDGVHMIDIAAVNARGQTTHRRVQFYAGAFYLTELGSRFEDNGTTFALRDIAPPSTSHRVELHVFATRDTNGTPTRAAEVFHTTQTGAQGPLRFFWNGQDTAGHAQPHARYIAELRFVDAAGNVVQRQETNFVHDTPESQRQQYGEVEGQLDADGRAAIANAQVELVDRNGNVVQTVNSTATGNYRFRGVSGGGYHVRVHRSGFRDAELPVNAAPAAAASAPMHLQAL